MNQELVKTNGGAIEWKGASQRGQIAKQERDAIVGSLLKEDMDFGKPFPGAPKATLLKAGAEKICDCLNIYPDYEIISQKENWDIENPVLAYTVKCTLKQRGTDYVVGTGIGSCNSFEDRYYWRKQERICVKCGESTIIKGNENYGGGWVCWKKKGGCGEKFSDGDPSIEKQEAGKVKNDKIFDQANTILKMAEKRAHVAATLNVGSFSEIFTQDLEDMPKQAVQYEKSEEKQPAKKSKPDLSQKLASYQELCKKAKLLGINYAEVSEKDLEWLDEAWFKQNGNELYQKIESQRVTEPQDSKNTAKQELDTKQPEKVAEKANTGLFSDM